MHCKSLIPLMDANMSARRQVLWRIRHQSVGGIWSPNSAIDRVTRCPREDACIGVPSLETVVIPVNSKILMHHAQPIHGTRGVRTRGT